jgi:hypothetical protein
MGAIIGKGRYARETYPVAPPDTTLDTSAISALLSILNNRVQRIGPLSAPGDVIDFESAAYTLFPILDFPGVLPGSPTVKVTGSASFTGTPGANVLVQLIRDSDAVHGPTVILAQQNVEIGATTDDTATATLVFLDTASTIDAVSGLPFPLLPLSTHTWTIEMTAASTLTGKGSALLLLEQEPGGVSVTFPTPNPNAPVFLGTAGDYASFGSAGITNTGPSSITGDLGTPSTASSITGFALALDGSGQFSTSSQVTGKVYAADYAVPTPAKVTTANNDMIAAYNEAAGRTPAAHTDFNGGILGGQTLTPGIWKWTTGVTIDGPLTFDGAGTYILQVAGTMELAVDTSIVLEGGALPQNIFWAVAGAITLHAGSDFSGELLAATSIAMQAGATATGRLLAQTGVTLISNTIVEQ